MASLFSLRCFCGAVTLDPTSELLFLLSTSVQRKTERGGTEELSLGIKCGEQKDDTEAEIHLRHRH